MSQALKQRLADYRKGNYDCGASRWKQVAWFLLNNFIIRNHYNPFSSIRCRLLRMFGAEIGKGVVIKPGVNIKYPWRLWIGDNAWIGEDVWIDNLANVRIESDVCISQGALLLTGSHNYKVESFDLIVSGITVKSGAWICARSIVTGGVIVGESAVLSAGSVTTRHLSPNTIYKGVPAEERGERQWR